MLARSREYLLGFFRAQLRVILFGAIETITVEREMPKRAGGETGVFVSANQQTESAVITVENTGAEAWPVRILDQVPYSEQDDLEVEVTASPHRKSR